MLAVAPTTSSSGSGVGFVFVAIVIIALFVLIRRASQKRVGLNHQVQSAAVIGSEVMTGSGLYGTVVGQDDEQVLLEIAPGVQVRFARAAIARVITENEFGDAEALENDDDAAEVPLEAPEDPPPAPHAGPPDDPEERPGDTTT